jgi:putative hydrolase of HD superfamily
MKDAVLDWEDSEKKQDVKNDRLDRQIAFVFEIDKLKGVLRRTILTDGSRQENAAEHSWHLAVMALLLSEYAVGKDIDLFRVIKMLLIHDIVEIDAGDTYCYDDAEVAKQAAREKKASERIYSILPPDQSEEFRGLWEEFEAGKTNEAQFANVLDCFQPILQNYSTNGKIWKKHNIRRNQVLARNDHVQDSAPVIWKRIVRFIDDAAEKGMLLK